MGLLHGFPQYRPHPILSLTCKPKINHGQCDGLPGPAAVTNRWLTVVRYAMPVWQSDPNNGQRERLQLVTFGYRFEKVYPSTHGILQNVRTIGHRGGHEIYLKIIN
jgi:hypothetical protein